MFGTTIQMQDALDESIVSSIFSPLSIKKYEKRYPFLFIRAIKVDSKPGNSVTIKYLESIRRERMIERLSIVSDIAPTKSIQPCEELPGYKHSNVECRIDLFSIAIKKINKTIYPYTAIEISGGKKRIAV